MTSAISPRIGEELLSPRSLSRLLGPIPCSVPGCRNEALVTCAQCGFVFYCGTSCAVHGMKRHRKTCRSVFVRPKPINLDRELPLEKVVNAIKAAIVEPDEGREFAWPKFHVRKSALDPNHGVLVIDVSDTGHSLSPRKNYINYMSIRHGLPFAVAARLPFLDYDREACEALALFVEQFRQINRGVLVYNKRPVGSVALVKCLFKRPYTKIHLQETTKSGVHLHAANRRTHYVLACYDDCPDSRQPLCIADPTIAQYDPSLPSIFSWHSISQYIETAARIPLSSAVAVQQSPRSPRLSVDGVPELCAQLCRNLGVSELMCKQ